MYPTFFSIGETPVQAYGLLLAVGLVLGWIISLRLARADKLPADVLGTGYVIAVGAGLLAARAMWMTGNESTNWTEIIQLQAGGMVGFGGVLVGLIAAVMFCQAKKIPAWPWLDAAAPAFMVGVVIERTAAFLAGADFGHYVDPSFFLAVEFPAESPVHAFQRANWSGLRVPEEHSLTVHPSQLYAAVFAAIAAVGAFVIRKRRLYSGQVALFVLGSYGVIRYLIEDPFRYDVTPPVAGPVSLGHLTGVAVAAVAIGAHFGRMSKLAEDQAGAQQWNGGPWSPDWDDGKKKKKKKKKKKSAKKSGDAKKADGKKSDGKKSDANKSDANKADSNKADANKSDAE